MSNLTEMSPIDFFRELSANVTDIFTSFEAAIKIEDNIEYTRNEEETLLFEAAFSFIKEVIKNHPKLILDSRLANGDNFLHFLLNKNFCTHTKVMEEVLKQAPQLIATRGNNDKTPLHHMTDEFDLGAISLFLQAYPNGASVLDGKNTILYNFTRQFPNGRNYPVYRNPYIIEESNVDEPPRTKAYKHRQSMIAKILQQLVDACPEAVFLRSNEDRLPIENIYHQYTYQGVCYHTSYGIYLLPILNLGGGIGAKFIAGMTYQRTPLFSDMTDIFQYKLLIGATLGGIPITRNVAGFEKAICSLNDLKVSLLQLSENGVNHIFNIVNRALVMTDNKSPYYEELLAIKNYLFFKKSPSLFFMCINSIANSLHTKELNLAEVLEKLPMDLNEPVINAYKGFVK